MHCGVLSSTPGFYPLNARICLPPGCDNQKCPQILPNVAWKAKSPPTLSSLQEIMHWAGRVRGGRTWTKQSAEHLFSLGSSLTCGSGRPPCFFWPPEIQVCALGLAFHGAVRVKADVGWVNLLSACLSASQACCRSSAEHDGSSVGEALTCCISQP